MSDFLDFIGRLAAEGDARQPGPGRADPPRPTDPQFDCTVCRAFLEPGSCRVFCSAACRTEAFENGATAESVMEEQRARLVARTAHRRQMAGPTALLFLASLVAIDHQADLEAIEAAVRETAFLRANLPGLYRVRAAVAAGYYNEGNR